MYEYFDLIATNNVQLQTINLDLLTSVLGLEVFPTVSKDPKEFLEEYFDVVQSIDPIWEDAYYDEMGKVRHKSFTLYKNVRTWF